MKTDIKNAFLKSAGQDPINPDPQIDAGMEILSVELTKTLVKWIQKQDFQITEMKALVQLEELTTTGTILGDVNPTVSAVVPQGSVMLPAGVPNPIPIPCFVQKLTGKKGVSIPALFLSLNGGHGGVLQSIGHAYVGINNVDPTETNVDNTKVKLLRPKELT